MEVVLIHQFRVSMLNEKLIVTNYVQTVAKAKYESYGESLLYEVNQKEMYRL